jgi:hypothetical protein
MFKRSKVNYSLANETSKTVYEYLKLKFQDTLARNMFKGSNVNYCMADETSEGVSEYIYKVQDRGLFDQKNVQ